MVCEPMVALRFMMANESTTAAERMYDPVRIVAWGAITTDDDMRVSMPPLPSVDEVLFGSLSPTIVFSPIMHPSPICMGPSNE